MISFLTSGIILGLSAGIAPGPLLVLVISETVQHGAKAGIRVALAPIITDLPIVIISLLLLAGLSGFHNILGSVSIIGACFILYLGISNIRTRGVQVDTVPTPPKSLQKGILVNFLSPHPYLFWLSVGGPLTIRAIGLGLFHAFLFVFSFYLLLVGSKIVLAILVSRSRDLLTGNKYIFAMRLLGVVLVVLALFLFRDGFQLLGIA